EERALAGTVRSDDREQGARRDRQAHVCERGPTTVPRGDAVQYDGRRLPRCRGDCAIDGVGRRGGRRGPVLERQVIGHRRSRYFKAATIWSTFQRIKPMYVSAGAGPSASL